MVTYSNWGRGAQTTCRRSARPPRRPRRAPPRAPAPARRLRTASHRWLRAAAPRPAPARRAGRVCLRRPPRAHVWRARGWAGAADLAAQMSQADKRARNDPISQTKRVRRVHRVRAPSGHQGTVWRRLERMEVLSVTSPLVSVSADGHPRVPRRPESANLSKKAAGGAGGLLPGALPPPRAGRRARSTPQRRRQRASSSTRVHSLPGALDEKSKVTYSRRYAAT